MEKADKTGRTKNNCRLRLGTYRDVSPLPNQTHSASQVPVPQPPPIPPPAPEHQSNAPVQKERVKTMCKLRVGLAHRKQGEESTPTSTEATVTPNANVDVTIGQAENLQEEHNDETVLINSENHQNDNSNDVSSPVNVMDQPKIEHETQNYLEGHEISVNESLVLPTNDSTIYNAPPIPIEKTEAPIEIEKETEQTNEKIEPMPSSQLDEAAEMNTSERFDATLISLNELQEGTGAGLQEVEPNVDNSSSSATKNDSIECLINQCQMEINMNSKSEEVVAVSVPAVSLGSEGKKENIKPIGKNIIPALDIASVLQVRKDNKRASSDTTKLQIHNRKRDGSSSTKDEDKFATHTEEMDSSASNEKPNADLSDEHVIRTRATRSCTIAIPNFMGNSRLNSSIANFSPSLINHGFWSAPKEDSGKKNGESIKKANLKWGQKVYPSVLNPSSDILSPPTPQSPALLSQSSEVIRDDEKTSDHVVKNDKDIIDGFKGYGDSNNNNNKNNNNAINNDNSRTNEDTDGNRKENPIVIVDIKDSAPNTTVSSNENGSIGLKLENVKSKSLKLDADEYVYQSRLSPRLVDITNRTIDGEPTDNLGTDETKRMHTLSRARLQSQTSFSTTIRMSRTQNVDGVRDMSSVCPTRVLIWLRRNFEQCGFQDVSIVQLEDAYQFLWKSRIVSNWIEDVLPGTLDAAKYDLGKALSDGVLLCLLANKIQANAVTKYRTRNLTDPFVAAENISLFLTACRNCFAIAPSNLFSVIDLMDQTDIPSVVATLCMLLSKAIEQGEETDARILKWRSIRDKRIDSNNMCADYEIQIAVQKMLPVLTGSQGTKYYSQF